MLQSTEQSFHLKSRDVSFPAFAGIPVFFIYFQPILEAFSPDSHTFSGF